MYSLTCQPCQNKSRIGLCVALWVSVSPVSFSLSLFLSVRFHYMPSAQAAKQFHWLGTPTHRFTLSLSLSLASTGLVRQRIALLSHTHTLTRFHRLGTPTCSFTLSLSLSLASTGLVRQRIAARPLSLSRVLSRPP